MEDLRCTENLYSEQGSCIICLKILTRKEENLTNGGGRISNENSPEVVADKSVVTRPGFLRTFNKIMVVIINRRNENSCSSEGSEEITLESVITEELGSVYKSKTAVEFLEQPTICQRCCDKVLAVQNLVKAVKQQVREIQLLWEESRREGVALEDFQREVKDEGEMECDEDLPNSLEDDDDGGSAADEDDSNWKWEEDDDPDYIKSEQDEEDDEEEWISEEEHDEEPLTRVESQNGPSIPAEDPLEIPSSSATVSKKRKKILGPVPGPVPSPLAKHEFSCDVKGCSRKFKFVTSLITHRTECHTVEKATSKGSTGFTCDLEACTRTLPTKESLLKHKMSCHTKIMIELEKLDPRNKFPCSCGRRFPTHRKLYTHQRKNKTAHPDFEFKLRETRSQLIGGQPCDVCGEPVKLKNILEHLASHLEGGAEYVVKCPNFNECRHAFTHSKDLLDKHLVAKRFGNCRKMGEEIKLGLKCETCGFTTDQRIKLAPHVANEHERGTLPKNLKCPISGCGKTFAVKQSIFLHLHVHRTTRKVNQICDKCGEDVKVEEMEVHLKDKHGILEVFGCKQCPLKFGERDAWVEHLWEHRDAGLSCDICGDGDDKPVKYLKYSDFRDHYWGMHKLCPKRYKCGQCENRSFWKKAELAKHQYENHRAEDNGPLAVDNMRKKKLHKCDICDGNVSYGTMDNLISHKIKMHGADPFKCDICGETFHRKLDFSRHKKEHAGMVFQKEWKCEVEGCGRIFGAKKSLKGHTLTMHVAEKPFVCEDCGKGYGEAKGLKTHRNSVYLGIRPWLCDECGESFTVSSILKRHKMIHSGERPFECEICGQRFRHLDVLRRHVEGHEKKGAEFKPNGPMKQIRKRKAQ